MQNKNGPLEETPNGATPWIPIVQMDHVTDRVCGQYANDIALTRALMKMFDEGRRPRASDPSNHVLGLIHLPKGKRIGEL